MKWHHMDTAPRSGLVLLTVESKDGSERRTYVAEASYGDDDKHYWAVTCGRAGFVKLHGGWKPICWARIPPPLTPSSWATRTAD